MYFLENLPDELLTDSYFKAIELKLDYDFVCLLVIELEKRNLGINLPYAKVAGA